MGTGRSKAEARIRRGYFECRYGQLHVHNAIPPGGGFDEGTPVIVVHHAPMSGAAFGPLLPLLGRDRSVYAPDLPGCGESDSPPARPSVGDYGAALADFCDSMRFRQVDVVGYQSGSFVGVELALARPDAVRKLVCIALPLASEAEREAFRRAPWPAQPAADGSHLALEWDRVRRAAGPGSSVERSTRWLAERLRNGPHAWWGMMAALEYPARERLGRLTPPTLIIRPKDDWWMATLRGRELMPKAKLIELPDVAEEAIESNPERLADVLRGFLTP